MTSSYLCEHNLILGRCPDCMTSDNLAPAGPLCDHGVPIDAGWPCRQCADPLTVEEPEPPAPLLASTGGYRAGLATGLLWGVPLGAAATAVLRWLL